MTKKFTNPFDLIQPQNDREMEATAAVYNTQHAICPKCNNKMSEAKICGDVVYYCRTDRVSTPRLNEEY